jgi:NTP pyrophosphatase (non-canonical NTP hydrolase)
MSELGDIMWYVANIADRYDMTLHQVSEYNQIKLIKRGKSV